MWDRVLPWAAGVFAPPGMDESYAQALGFGVPEIFAFGMRSFETKVRRVGIDPAEIPMLGRLERDLSYEERARRAWTLVRCDVIGTDGEPHPDAEVMEMIFHGVAEEVDPRVLASLGGPVQWTFTDAAAWHVLMRDGAPQAVPGPADRPALVVRTTTAEWTKIAVDRADPRRSVLSGRLKVQGSMGSRLKFAKLFGRPVIGQRRRSA